MTAPTVSEPPELPTFPTGPGLPDQPGVFIPQFLLYLTWFTSFRAYLVELIAYFEGLSVGGSSSGASWIPAVTGAEPVALLSNGAGELILIAGP